MSIDGSASFLQSADMEWLDIKIWLEDYTGFDRDALHIYGAVAIQFLVAIFCTRRLGSLWPLVAVLIAALANEYADYQRLMGNEALQTVVREEAYKDLWNTMLIPIALMLVARFFPSWMTSGQPVSAGQSLKSGNPEA